MKMNLGQMRTWFIKRLGTPPTLILLFVINGLGTIYGYYWYRNQLASTEQWYLLPFVPDSPTASLLFTVVLILYLFGRQSGLLEAFASVTLVKYGIWATVMLVWTGLLGGELHWTHYMLIASHLGMALEALLYIPYYRFNPIHLTVVAVWVLINDLLDYTVPIFPWLDQVLHPFLPFIFLFTVGLSLVSLLVFYITVAKRW
jgi:uncharacterized membrane protein YpjA